MFVNRELLEAKCACEDQLNLFNELFPKGVELTRELILEHARKFDWDWYAKNLLSDQGFKTYWLATKPSQEAYIIATKPAREAYYPDIGPAREAYKLATKQAREALNIARATAFADVLGL